MSRGNSLSDELELSSVLGDTRAYLYSPVLLATRWHQEHSRGIYVRIIHPKKWTEKDHYAKKGKKEKRGAKRM